jgi:Inner membrane protein YgaP-like, transmembrane domain
MNKNVGTIDRVVRAVIGVAAVIGAFSVGLTSVWGIVLAVVAVIALVTAIVGFCPLYRLLGISTHTTQS